MFPVYPETLLATATTPLGAPIVLEAGSAPMRLGTLQGSADYRVEYQVTPAARVRVYADFRPGTEGGRWAFGRGIEQDVALAPSLSSSEVQLILLEMRGMLEAELVAAPAGPRTCLGRTTDLAAVGFGLLNLPVLAQQRSTSVYQGGCPPNAVLVENNGWTCIAWPREDLADVLRSLGRGGGHAVTHVAVVRRSDGQPFALAEADEFLDLLFWLLTFARGAWGGPVAVRMLGPRGEEVGRIWESPKQDSHLRFRSWLNPLRADALQTIAPHLSAKLAHPLWGQTMRSAVHWYVSANRREGGLEGSIVLTQTALELLAWQHLVKDAQVLSPDGFKRLPASDRLRLLLSTIGVPIALPEALPHLCAVAKKAKWVDGPHATTVMRNRIVHPDERRVPSTDDETYLLLEASELALFYLELTLLGVLAYQGEVHDRLHLTVARVPWAA